MRRSGARFLAVAAAAFVATLVVGAGVAWAGPKAPPDYGDSVGQQNPQGLDHCWHPDPVKCITTGWASGEEVHIVADPLVGTGTGTVVFWCQSIVGFKYQISVAGLAGSAWYTVTTVGAFNVTLGSFRTDPNGFGTLNGLLKLPPGGYYVVLQVRDTSNAIVLQGPATDGQGFAVFDR